MAIFFQIDGKVAIAAIAGGEYQDFYFYQKRYPI
jgi:hypothetical protein